MYLGIAAALSGIVYAFVKFLTMTSFRRLRSRVATCQTEVQRSEQRVQILEERLQFEGTKKRGLQRETREARKAAGEIFTELKSSLPNTFGPGLEECCNLARVTEFEDRRMLHDLKVTDKIAGALQSHSLLLFEFLGEEESDRAMLTGILTELIERQEVNYSNPERAMLLCSFDAPQPALELVREYVQQVPESGRSSIRSSLSAGVDMEDERTDVSQLFARVLQSNRNLVDRTAAGTLIMNGSAYDHLEGDNKDVVLFEKDELLYVLDWQAADSVEKAS
jgi:hypothetical protein